MVIEIDFAPRRSFDFVTLCLDVHVNPSVLTRQKPIFGLRKDNYTCRLFYILKYKAGADCYFSLQFVEGELKADTKKLFLC